MKTVNLQIQTVRLAGLFCLLLAWTACSDETVIDPPGEDTPIMIRAEISTSDADTRADGRETTETVTDDPANVYDRSSFIANDKIRVTRTNPSDSKDYLLGADGKWAVVGTAPLTLRIRANYEATFPHDYKNIQKDQSMQANYLASNLLKSPAATSSSGELNFTGDNAFLHQNTKITLVFTGKAGADASGKGAALTGTFSNFTITGTGLYTGGASSEQMSFYRPEANVATWHGIVYPQKGTSTTGTDISLALTYDNVKYSATIKCPMEAGKHYRYDLKIENDILIPDGMTIENWKSGESYTGGFDTAPNT